MNDSLFNEYDILVLVIMIISTLLSILRGFLREIFSLSGWIGAGIITFLFFGKTAEYLSSYFESKVIVSAVTVIGLYGISLVIISIMTMVIMDFSRAVRLGAIDRSLGLAFGFARGMIIVSIIHFGITLIYNKIEDEPEWFKEAKTYNFTNFGANLLKELTHDFIYGMKTDDYSQRIIERLGGRFAEYTGGGFASIKQKNIFQDIIAALPKKDKEKFLEKLSDLGENPPVEEKNNLLSNILSTYSEAHEGGLIPNSKKISDGDYEILKKSLKSIRDSDSSILEPAVKKEEKNEWENPDKSSKETDYNTIDKIELPSGVDE